MIKKLLLGLAFTLSLTCTQARADQPVYGANGANTGIPSNAPLLTSAPSASMTDERTLRSLFGNITLTDGGANSYLDINWSGQLGLTDGGTGGASAQAATNNLLDGSAGAAAANGDQIVRVAGNWTRVPAGTDTFVWTMVTGQPAWAASASGAPAGASYVCISLDGSLTSERVLTGTANRVTITDGGAGGNVTLNVGSDVVLLTSTQTLTNKTLTSPSIGTSLIFELGANDITIQGTAPAAARLYTIPDAGAAASFVMTEGAQTINGVKTMGSATRFNAQIQNSSGNTITLPSSAATLATLALTETLTNKTATGLILDGTPAFKSTNQYNITINNPAANRAYSITDVGGSANFIMGTGAYTNQGIAIANGSLLTWLAPGSSNQVVKMSGSTVAWGTDVSGGFGGDGNQGAVTKGAVTETTPIQVNATTYTQSVSTTHNLISNSIINANSTAAFNGSSVVGTKTNGMIGQVDISNTKEFNGAFGPYAGRARNGGATRGSGGGGGGFGAAGGSGAQDAAGNIGGQPGQASIDIIGAGGAGGGDGTNAGGNGGNGGGELTVCAIGAITLGSSSTVSANGAAGSAGSAGSAGGGGGGPGGKVIMASQASITISSGATASVNGGAGAAAAGANGGVGGGGSGGRWYSIAPSITHTAAPTASGGAAGSGTGTTTGSAAGSAGVVASITATPTLPMLGLIRKNDSMAVYIAFRKFQGKRPDSKGNWHLSGDEAIYGLAAFNAINSKHQRELAHAIEFGKQLDSRETCLLINDDGNAEALRYAS